ncbi:CubicO group peptidase (beta-lactamase class C family) [Micromonospora pisi]|uniref:CubicO group peptidase (Beta-lactamase class C family) n=1 Tax=Micromonospora pisi TaxID=589240 RepID=A0A495JEG2_9ACTN|nr:serine hydrolase domain-containing protein [Micromonospora pisi]RKR86918.1 CubicO group peptidase (beta-lactamase class C family) [Micromonospora pisi]
MALLLDTTRRLDTLVAETQATAAVPTLVAGVVRDGVLAHVTSAGEPPPDPGTQYRIGSITKTMTAALVLRLRDEGRLALDDPLDRHLPGTPVGTVTLRQLLGHASGLQREPESDGWWERTEGADLAALLAGLTPAKLAHPPYRVFHYSNLAYGLLGGVLERLTGQSWWDLLRERLLGPLGLTRTSYQAEAPYALGYVVHPWHGTLREEPRTDTGAMAPAGQLWASTADLARWAAFLADPDPALLAPETVTEMCAPVVMNDLDSWTSGHGLGLELYRSGERVYIGHGGSMPGYVAGMMVHRPSRTAVVTFANAYGFRSGSIGALTRQLLTEVLDREPNPVRAWRPADGPPEPAVAELTGRWWFMAREFEASWDGEAEELLLTLLRPAGAAPWRFARVEPDRWRGRSGMNDGEILAVRRNPDGSVRALDIATFVFTRDPDRLD